MNCFSCRWHKLKGSEELRRRAGMSMDDIAAKCHECVSAFADRCATNTPTCYTCPWKDRMLPYEERAKHCRACAEAFAKGSHECGKCPWNDRKRPMPTDAALAHCKACLAKVEGKTAMNCASCPWRNTPEAVRAKHCASCSIKFAGNGKVVAGTNELSNKGQTIESYDNHNASMSDDRDTVTQIRPDYVESRKSTSKPNMPHPVFDVAERCGMTIEEFAQNAYDMSKRFLYELSSLTDLQALLFLSTIRGEAKTDFAKNHNITDTAVNQLFKQILYRSETFRSFILLSRGTLAGTRGRKSKKNPNEIKVPKKTKKIVYCGVSQMSFVI